MEVAATASQRGRGVAYPGYDATLLSLLGISPRTVDGVTFAGWPIVSSLRHVIPSVVSGFWII